MSLTSSSRPAALSETIHERFVTIQGCKMRYLTGGAGPALVLLHGLMGYSFCWRLNLEPLARHLRVFALDLPGTGFSSRKPALAGDITSLAEYTLAFLEAMEINSATLMGSSHGGGLALVAASLAAKRNISVPAMVLVAPVNPWSSQGTFLTRLGASAAGARIVRTVAPTVTRLHGTIVKRLYADPRRVTPETVGGYSSAMNVPGTIDALLGRIKDWKNDMARIEQALPEISEIPTLLIWGEKDGAVYLSSAAELMKRLHHGELRVIAGAGHLAFEEQPEEFNRLVIEFLMKVRACSKDRS